MKEKRALTLKNVEDYRPNTMGFSGRWLDTIGDPDPSGSWIIYGESGNGKTRFALQLSKYLLSFKRVRMAYNSLEEGLSTTFAQAILQTGLQTETKGHFELWSKYDLPEMLRALEKKRSPNVIIIDSIQYLGISYDEYKELVKKYPRKLFIWLSHEAGSKPDGQVARKVLYNSDVKIRVKNYYANITSRYQGKSVFDIWPDGHIQLNIK